MTNSGSLQPRPTKNERRDAAREKARLLREDQQKKAKRNRLLWQIGAIVGVVAILVAVFFGYQSWQKGQIAQSAGPANMLSDGLVITSQGPVLTDGIPAGGLPTPTATDSSSNALNIAVYVDYLCPYCGQFENTNNAYLQQLVQNGATLEMHPIAILTSNSAGTRFSERAANAFACVANTSPDAAVAFNALLFANQPEEGSTGLSNDQLKDFAAQAGATNTATINRCIDDQQFKNWVQASTDRALANTSLRNAQGQFGTPTIMVNGQKYSGSLTDSSEFKAFVVQASAETGASATPTPAP
ncbi:MAG: DsbA family protein [Microbacteriaceae bacterium]